MSRRLEEELQDIQWPYRLLPVHCEAYALNTARHSYSGVTWLLLTIGTSQAESGRWHIAASYAISNATVATLSELRRTEELSWLRKLGPDTTEWI